MREYNYLQAIYMSFYSRQLYRDVAENWGAGVVLYLFFLLAICWGVMMFKFQPAINIGAAELADKVVTQMPELVVKNGQLSTPENRPYLITDVDNKSNVVMIIDSSGKYTNLEGTPANTKILVTKDKIYYYDKNNNLKMQKIPEKFDMTFVPEKVKDLIKSFASWLWVIVLPFFLVFSFVYRLIQALIYAVIGKIFAALMDVSLTYSQVLKLSMIIVTPAIIIGTIFDWCGVMFRFQWLLMFFISMVYLVFAIKANKRTEMVVK